MSNSKNFSELFDQHVPDVFLAKKHKELLKAGQIAEKSFSIADFTEKEIRKLFHVAGIKLLGLKQTIPTEHSNEPTEWLAIYLSPDTKTQAKMTEEAYKLKGHYEPTETRLLFDKLTDEELVRKAKDLITGINSDSTGTEVEE